MSNDTISMLNTLIEIVSLLPIGTNLALLHLMWAMVSGQFLASRGAVFPALAQMGLSEQQVRRAGQALRSGGWSIGQLLVRWEAVVMKRGRWQVRSHGGYNSLAIDLTGFWRPTLKNCSTKHYHHGAGKALPAMVLALIGRVGEIEGQRLALPLAMLRLTEQMANEAELQREAIRHGKVLMTAQEVMIVDGGFLLADLLTEKVPRYVLKLAKNFTARRSEPAAYQGKGRPTKRGELVRPLERTYKGKTLPATPADRTLIWQDDHGVEIKTLVWEQLVLSMTTASQFAAASPQTPLQTFTVMAFFDPQFEQPLLLATNLAVEEKHVRGLYLDRWPIEQLPLAAKQMQGMERAFVSSDESCYRLPELALLTSSILSFEAASTPATPTGFWDKKPRATPGRLRRVLAKLGFPTEMALPDHIRQKYSVTDHLPKGFWGQKKKSDPI
jgi:hypothetical protein